MNDVQFVEAARHFATRAILEGGATFEDRLNHAFKLATSRPADARRQAVLKRLYLSDKERFLKDTKRAEDLLGYGESGRNKSIPPAEHAAWTLVASAILNLDEVLTAE